jgi:hypothetical protein
MLYVRLPVCEATGAMDKLAAVREHGLKGAYGLQTDQGIDSGIAAADVVAVFSSSLVNGFDLVFMLIYAVYLGARTYGFHYGSADALALGADFLAIGKTGSSDELWRALMAWYRCGTHLPKTGFRNSGKQLDGPEHTLHAHGVLLCVGFRPSTRVPGEEVWIGIRHANCAFSLDGCWHFLLYRICVRPLHARTRQVSVADEHLQLVICGKLTTSQVRVCPDRLVVVGGVLWAGCFGFRGGS